MRPVKRQEKFLPQVMETLWNLCFFLEYCSCYRMTCFHYADDTCFHDADDICFHYADDICFHYAYVPGDAFSKKIKL